MTTETGGRKRKTSVRSKSGKRYPAISEALRRRYEDPVQREITRQNMLKIKGGRPLGSYDGVRKKERIAINERATQIAQETILKMADQGILTPQDDPRAVKALQAAVEVMATPANQQAKLAAARLILDFTKSKPAAKSEVTVNKAEEWLAAITKEESNAEGPAGDSEEASE